jgi:AcrR family transcriptional regulator
MNKEAMKSNSRKIQAEEMKLHLLDAALSAFASKGFSKTSIKDLAKEAGISQGLMYHYFDSKEALLTAVVEHHSFLPQLRHILTNDKKRSFREVLSEIANAFLKLLDNQSMLFKIFMQESDTNPEVKRIWVNLCQEGVTLLHKFILSRIAAGEIRDHNAEVTSRSLFYILVMFHSTRDVFQSSKVNVKDFIKVVLDNLINGIGKSN